MIFLYRTRFLIIFSLLILSISIVNANDNTDMQLEVNDKNTNNQVKVWEDGMRTSGEDNSSEWWYFDGISDNDIKLVIVFNVKVIAKTKQPYININITFPDGKSFAETYPFPKNELQASSKTCDVTIGKNRFMGDLDNYSIHLDLDDIKSEISLERIAPSWKPKSKCLVSKKEQFGYLHAVPHGNMKGYFTYQDKKYEIKGTGYHDHTWYTVSTSNLSQRLKQWYWGRALFDNYTVIFAESMTSLTPFQKNKNKILYVAKNDNLIINDGAKASFYKKDFYVDPLTKRPIPNVIEIRYSEGGTKLNITLYKQLEMQSTGSHSENSYHRFTGAGIFEIETNGNKEKHYANPIWEIKYLDRQTPYNVTL